MNFVESLVFLSKLVYNTFCTLTGGPFSMVIRQQPGYDNHWIFVWFGGPKKKGKWESFMAKSFGGTNSFLADRLRQARLKAGYSQQNIADALNMNRATYSYYESGKTSPDPVTLGKIARIYGAPIEFFFEEEDDERVPVLLTDRERCPKKPSQDPNTIGELAPDERKLIALLRASQKVSTEDAVDWVHRQLENYQGK